MSRMLEQYVEKNYNVEMECQDKVSSLIMTSLLSY